MDELIRTLVGTIFLMSIIILVVYCCFKYAECQEKEEKKNKIINVSEPIGVLTTDSQKNKYSSLV